MAASRFAGYLPPASDSLSLLPWGKHYLPHYYVNEPSGMHRWIGRKADESFDRRGGRIAVVGPRGGAKSTTGSLTLPLRRAVSGRESYIIISSDTVTQAVDHIRSIKEELEDNAALAADYPEACGVGPIWQDKYIKMRNGCVIRAVGTLSRIRGARKRQHRPSLIIVDDPENDEHITSTRMRDRVRTWFNRTLLSMGDDKTNILAMGTAIHRDCLVMKLLRTSGWQTHRDLSLKPAVFKSIVKWPVRMDLWAKWESIYFDVDDPEYEKRAAEFFRKNRREMEKGCELLWPDREPLYMLMKLRAEMGHQEFEAEKQGNPLNPETCEWPEEYFEGDDLWFKDWPPVSEHAARVVALDPSKGKDARHGDPSAIVKLVVDHRGIFYFDASIDRRSTDRIVDDTVEILRRFRPTAFGCEVNQFQELLAEDISEAMREADVDVPIEKIDNRVNKKVRIRRLSPLLAKRRIRFRSGSKGAVKLHEQTRDFPNGDHDDGPDAAEMATRIALDLLGETVSFDDGIGDTLEVNYGR